MEALRINPIDVNVYPDNSVYRNQPYMNEYGAPGSPSYGYNSYDAPLHAHETRFLMESLAVATPLGVSASIETPNYTMQQLPTTTSFSNIESGSSSVAGSHRSSDSDGEDTEDADIDTSKFTKEELRKHKNRQSAARSRKRNRDRMGQLEALVRQLSQKNRQLEEQVQALLLERAAVERQAHMTSSHPPTHLHMHQPPPSHLPMPTPYY